MFKLSDLVCMLLYGLITALFLYTGVVSVIQSILSSYGDKGNQVAVQLGQSMPVSSFWAASIFILLTGRSQSPVNSG